MTLKQLRILSGPSYWYTTCSTLISRNMIYIHQVFIGLLFYTKVQITTISQGATSPSRATLVKLSSFSKIQNILDNKVENVLFIILVSYERTILQCIYWPSGSEKVENVKKFTDGRTGRQTNTRLNVIRKVQSSFQLKWAKTKSYFNQRIKKPSN